MSPPSLPQAHHHPFPLSTLTPHLLPLLPNSLPLLRRIQLQPPSPHSQVFATFPPATPPPPPTSSTQELKLQNPPRPPFEFAACWVDRTRAPETECWVFSTWEVREGGNYGGGLAGVEDGCEGGLRGKKRIEREEGAEGGGGDEDEEEREEARLHLLAVLNAIAESHHPPPLPPPPPHATPPLYPDNNLLIIGSLHDSLIPLLTSPTDRFEEKRVLSRNPTDDDGNDNKNDTIDAAGQGVLARIGQPVVKYLIPPPSSSPPPYTPSRSPSPPPPPSSWKREKDPSPLPPNYHPSHLHPSDLQTCIQKTDIPHTITTLSSLTNTCVRFLDPGFCNADAGDDNDDDDSQKEREGQEKEKEKEKEKGELIAWAFLSADGSLSSLFVEPGHRGRGIARAVVRGLVVLASGKESEEGGGGGGGGEGEGDEEGEMREKGERGKGWVSSDVYFDNEGGRGVAMGVGGKEGWVCRWVGCDLGRVRAVWGREEGKHAAIGGKGE